MLFDKPLRELPPFLQLLLLLLLCLLSGGLFAMIGMSTASLFTGLPASAYLEGTDLDGSLAPLIWHLQAFTSVGVFVVPGLLFSYYWDYHKPFAPLGFHHQVPMSTLFWVKMTVLVSIPLVYTIYGWNQSLQLPPALAELEQQWRASESQAERTIGLLLERSDPTALFLNLLVLVLLPAFGEELIFRGILQRSLLQASGRPHLAIWVSAALFSAIHMQWFGFLPRLLLGAFFGYLVYWTGSLLPAFIGHFANNALAVLGEYAAQHEWFDWETETLIRLPWPIVLLSFLLTALLLFILHRQKNPAALVELD